jgi:ankyrin repeat protein
MVIWKLSKLLLKHAEDKNPAAKDGLTPLHSAAEESYLKIVKLLLEHAEDKNPEVKEGHTPLHLATLNGHLEIVKIASKAC